MGELLKLHNQQLHNKLISALSERRDLQKAGIERINQLVVTNLKNNQVSSESIRILLNAKPALETDKLEKSLTAIGKKIFVVRVDVASDIRVDNGEFDMIMEIISKKCTNLKRLEIYDCTALTTIWEESCNYSSDVLKKIEELRIVGPRTLLALPHPASPTKNNRDNMYKKIMKYAKFLKCLELGQNLTAKQIENLIKSNGSLLERLKLVMKTNLRGTAYVDFFKKICPKLKTFEYLSTFIDQEFNSQHVRLLSSYGKQLEFANLDNIDVNLCKQLVESCPQAKFDLDMEGQLLGMRLESARILGKQLRTLKAGKNDNDGIWRASLDPCVELESLDIDLVEYSELETLIKSKMAKLRKLTVSNNRGNINNHSLDFIVENTGELRELKIFCGRVQEKALDGIINANRELEYLEVDVDFSGFEETMAMRLDDSKKLEAVDADRLRGVLTHTLRAVLEHKKLKVLNFFSGIPLEASDWNPVFAQLLSPNSKMNVTMEQKWGKEMSLLIKQLLERGVGVKLCGEEFYPVGFWIHTKNKVDKKFFDGQKTPSF